MAKDTTMENKKSNVIIKNLLLIAIVVGLAIIPLFIAKDAEFGGADGEAEQAITEINADYEPWFSPLFEPKSGEIESLLFSLQAAIGSGIVFYGLGYMKGQKNKEEVTKQ